MKQKYVKLKNCNSFIFFPCEISHLAFNNFELISAGFCYVNAEDKKVDCFKEYTTIYSDSINVIDSIEATKQIFGINSMINWVNNIYK